MEKGDKIWVEQAGGGQRAAVYVGEDEEAFGGGGPRAYVAYPETGQGEIIEMMRIIPRAEDSEEA
jgi:hypothetical protein